MKLKNLVFLIGFLPALAVAISWPVGEVRAGDSGAAESSSTLEKSAGKLLAAGWERYNAGEYRKALDLFNLAAQSGRSVLKSEALLGQTYSLQKLGRLEEAEKIVRDLAESGFRPEETWPLLMDLLISAGRPDEARVLLDRLPASKSDSYRQRLAVDKTTTGAGSSLLEAAWTALEEKKYGAARDLFQTLTEQTTGEDRLNARLGLAYALWNLGRVDEARAVMEELLEQNYKPDAALTALIDMALARGDLPAAREYLARLPEGQGTSWNEKILAAEQQARVKRLDRMLGQAWNLFNAKAYERAFDLFSTIKKQSPRLARDASFGLALAAWKLERLDTAKNELTALVESGFQLNKTLPVLIAVLIDRKDPDEAGIYLDQARSRPKAPAEFKSRIRDLETAWLAQKMETLEAGDAEHLRIARELHSRKPDDPGLESALAWSCLAARDYPCALSHFSVLYRKKPENSEMVTGLASTLRALKKPDEALDLTESYSGPPDQKLNELKVNLYQETGQIHYDKNRFKTAEALARKGLEVDPENQGLLDLLGWSLYKQDKLDEALEIFKKSFKKEKTSGAAKGLMAVLETSGDDRAYWDLLAALAEDPESPELNRLAADKYFREGWPLMAAQTRDDPESCQYNCDGPGLDLGPKVTYKKGDGGTARLTRYSIPAGLRVPLPKGRWLKVNLNPEFLDAGSAPRAVYAGSYYRYLDDPDRPVDDFAGSSMTYRPSVGLEGEGPWSYLLQAGTTPLGGPVSALPEFLFRLRRPGNFQMEIHQHAVEDTFQSLVGQKDPYTGRTWGRMVRTGLSGEKSLPLPSPFWLTLSGGVDYIWGKNAADNYHYRAALAIGRTDVFRDWLVSSGLLGTIEHYDRNADFYTFGHGGYFSPALFVLAGPFLRWQSPVCKGFRLDLNASAGYMYYRTEGAPHYRHLDDDPGRLNASARADYWGRYEGKTETGVGVNFKLAGLKQIGRRLALGGQVEADSSSNHFRYSGSLVLRFSLKPHDKICCGFSF